MSTGVGACVACGGLYDDVDPHVTCPADDATSRDLRSGPLWPLESAPLDLFSAWSRAIEQRDRARGTAARLEQELAHVGDRIREYADATHYHVSWQGLCAPADGDRCDITAALRVCAAMFDGGAT